MSLGLMEHFPVSKNESGFHVEGFPDAAKLVRLDDPKARRISDLVLHKRDLDFAADCLTAINQVPVHPPVVRDAIWSSAIVHYMKCFGDSGARFQLSAERIYKGEPPEAIQNHQFFRDLRNKHVVHDENSYDQCIPGAVLNKGDKIYKIEKIICLGGRAVVLGQDTYNTLKLLIDKAHAWVVGEFDTCCKLVTEELEKLSYEELLRRESVVYPAPTLDDIAKNRRARL
jgi:hypothetical protein